MNNPDFHRAIGRIRRRHWLHYLVQTLLMVGLVLASTRTLAAVAPARGAALASGPMLGVLAGLALLGGLGLRALARQMAPNLRRLAEENLRVYQSRVLLRDSVLLLSGLPLLLAYGVAGSALAWWPTRPWCRCSAG